MGRKYRSNMNMEQTDTVPRVVQDEAFWTALFLQEGLPQDAHEPEPDPGRLVPAGNGSDIASSPTWQLAMQALASDSILRLPVVDFNKGGLLVSWYDLQGFVPASQLLDFPLLHVAEERQPALASFLETILELKIIEVERDKNRLVLSERAALVKAEEKLSRLHQIREGDVLSGQVTNLTDFGAFVDLGGIEGLIHISELSWSRVTHPSQIVEPGQAIEVLVLNVDRQQERVALSHKRLRKNPWRTVEERYSPGDVVKGEVSSIVNFGVFVLLEKELEGLIHISELAEGSFLHPRNVVQEGQVLQARVLRVNGKKKRLSLSLRRLN